MLRLMILKQLSINTKNELNTNISNVKNELNQNINNVDVKVSDNKKLLTT